MTDYISVRIDCTPCSEDITDLAASFLADAGFESFEPDDTGLTAYVQESLHKPGMVAEALADFPIPTQFSITEEKIKGQNWNEEWEKHYFKPIVVGGEVVVHSSFHTDVPEAKYDIVVDPKMAFGTGHHYTTRLMMGRILNIPISGLTVTDMGTGTGILAILCSMRGATQVTGIEIDEGAWENAVENVALNKVAATMINGDASVLPQVPKCNLFMANINRNIILNDIAAYAENLLEDGTMLLSGFYAADVDVIVEAARPLGLEYVEQHSENDWTVLTLRKKKN